MVAGGKKIAFLKKRKVLFPGQRKAAWLWLDCAHVSIERKVKTATLLSTLPNAKKRFLCWQTSSAVFFFFFKDTHTQALANLSMLPCHQKQVREQINSLREHDKQRRGEKELQGYGDNMCQRVYPHNVCVYVWRGNIAVSQERPWFRGSLWLYSKKQLSLTTNRFGSGRTWRGSVASKADADFFFF